MMVALSYFCDLMPLFYKVGFFHRKKREELREITNRMSRLPDPKLLAILEQIELEGEQMETVNLND